MGERKRVVTAWLAAVVVLLTSVAAVRGQFEEEDYEAPPFWLGYYVPRFRTERLRVMEFFAEVSVEQRKALDELHAEYLRRFHAANAKYTEFCESFRSEQHGGCYTDDPEINARIREASRGRDEFAKRLEAAVLEDFRAALTEEQQSSLPLVESTYRQSLSLPWRAGLGCDIAELVPPALGGRAVTPGLRAAVVKYTRERGQLFEALRGRDIPNPWRFENDATLTPADRAAKRREVFIECMMLAAPIRELDAAMLGALRDHLPPERLEYLEHRYFQSMQLGDWWGHERMWKSLAALGDLTQEQREGLASVRADDRRRMLVRMRARWERLVRTPPDELLDSDGRIVDGEQDWKEEEAQEIAVPRAIRALLTPEQAARSGPPISVKAVVVPRYDDPDWPMPEPERFSDGRPDGWITLDHFVWPIEPEDIEFIIEVARLDAVQADAAKELYAECIRRFRRAALQQQGCDRDCNNALRAGLIDRDAGADISKRSNDLYSEHATRLRDGLIADLHAIVPEERVAEWERCAARLRHRRLLSRYYWAIEPLALLDIPLALQVALGEEAGDGTISDALVRYETESAPIVERLIERSERIDEMWAARGGNQIAGEVPEAIAAETRRSDEDAARLRAMNLACIDRISAMLSGVSKEYFEEAAFDQVAWRARNSYSSAEIRWSARDLLECADGIDAITDEARVRMRAIVGENVAGLVSLNRTIVTHLIEAEAGEAKDKWEARRSSALTRASEARTEAVRETIKKMVKCMTPEEQRALPEPYKRFAPRQVPLLPNYEEE